MEAVNLIDAGKAPRIPQPEEGASYDPYITAKPELAQIDWEKQGRSQRQLHNFIRGNDSVPGVRKENNQHFNNAQPFESLRNYS